jgi:hypothetical protein
MKASHSSILALVIILGGKSCFAQSINTPAIKFDLESANNHAAIRSLPDFSLETYLGTSSTGSSAAVSRPYATSPRTADTKFFLLNGLHLGMAVFDVEMTQRCITNHRCHETNPLMPSSQAGQLSINFALVSSISLASYWLKKHQSKLWWLPPVTGVAVHSYGVATGFEHQ